MSDGAALQPRRAPDPRAPAAPPCRRCALPARRCRPTSRSCDRRSPASPTSSASTPRARADMKIALTEACTNAVVHAYGEERGPLEVTMAVEHGRLVLGVRDRGTGCTRCPARERGPPLGFGLALIASLSDEFGHRRRAARDRGADRVRARRRERAAAAIQPSAEERRAADGIVLVLRPRGAPRRCSGASSRWSPRARTSRSTASPTRRSSATRSPAPPRRTSLDGALRVAIDEYERGFDLRVGPLAPAAAQRARRRHRAAGPRLSARAPDRHARGRAGRRRGRRAAARAPARAR